MSRLKLVMLSIVIFIVGGTGWYLLKAQRSNRTIPPPQLSTITAIPTLTPTFTPTSILPSLTLPQSLSGQPDTTATWETYTSSFGYTIKYPKKMSHSGGNDLPYDLQLTNNDLTMTFIVSGLPSNETAQNDPNSYCPLGAGASSRSQIQTINGIPVYRTPNSVNTSNNTQCQEAVISQQKENRIVDIQANLSTPIGNTLFNQILASFLLNRM